VLITDNNQTDTFSVENAVAESSGRLELDRRCRWLPAALVTFVDVGTPLKVTEQWWELGPEAARAGGLEVGREWPEQPDVQSQSDEA